MHTLLLEDVGYMLFGAVTEMPTPDSRSWHQVESSCCTHGRITAGHLQDKKVVDIIRRSRRYESIRRSTRDAWLVQLVGFVPENIKEKLANSVMRGVRVLLVAVVQWCCSWCAACGV